MGTTLNVVDSHATALQSLAKAAAADIQQTREVLADVSARVDRLAGEHDTFTARAFLHRLRWLVLGG